MCIIMIMIFITLTSADLLLVSGMTSYDTYSNIIHNSVRPSLRFKKKKKMQ